MIVLEHIEIDQTRVIHNGAVGMWRRPGVIISVIRREEVSQDLQPLMNGPAFIYVRFPELKTESGRVELPEAEGCYAASELDLV